MNKALEKVKEVIELKNGNFESLEQVVVMLTSGLLVSRLE